MPGPCVFIDVMMLPLLLAAAGAAHTGQFSQPLDVAQPVRLQLTPTLDGTLAKEEWDPFGQQTYLQWEPRKLFVAAQLPAGRDLVLSIDGKGNGWLVGSDNIEFRVSLKDGKPVLSARELDATAVKEPIWKDRPDLVAASSAACTIGAEGNTVEAVFDDTGLGILPQDSKTMLMRLDVADPNADQEAYIPRSCAPIRLDYQRAAALPREMDLGVQARTRAVIPGEDIMLRFNFHGTNSLGAKTIEMRSLGEAESAANRMAVLFPTFDNKGRAFVDYRTRIDTAAAVGYRIARGTLAFKDGPSAVVETSYRIAPYMDFTLLQPEFGRLPDNNTLRIRYLQQLYTHARVDGLVKVVPPKEWQVVSGQTRKFSVLGSQSSQPGLLEVRVPADAHGTFPITFTGETKERTVTQTCYVTIR